MQHKGIERIDLNESIQPRDSSIKNRLLDLLITSDQQLSNRGAVLFELVIDDILEEYKIDPSSDVPLTQQARGILESTKEYKSLSWIIAQNGGSINIVSSEGNANFRVDDYHLDFKRDQNGGPIRLDCRYIGESEVQDEIYANQLRARCKEKGLQEIIFAARANVVDDKNLTAFIAAVPEYQIYCELMNLQDERSALALIAGHIQTRVAAHFENGHINAEGALYNYLLARELKKLTPHLSAEYRTLAIRDIARDRAYTVNDASLTGMTETLTGSEHSSGLYEKLVQLGVRVENYDGDAISALNQLLEKNIPSLLHVDQIDENDLKDITSVDNYRALASMVERFLPADNSIELNRILERICNARETIPDFIKVAESTNSAKKKFMLSDSYSVSISGLNGALTNRNKLLERLREDSLSGSESSEYADELACYLEDSIYRLSCQSELWQVLKKRIIGTGSVVENELLTALEIPLESPLALDIRRYLELNFENRDTGSIANGLAGLDNIVTIEQLNNVRQSAPLEEQERIAKKLGNDESKIINYYREGIIIEKTKHILGSKQGSVLQAEISRFSSAVYFYFHELDAVRQPGVKSRQSISSIANDVEQITNQIGKTPKGKIYLPFYYALCKTANQARVGLSRLIDVGELDMLHKLADVANRSSQILGTEVEWVLVNEADEALPLMYSEPNADEFVKANTIIARAYIQHLANQSNNSGLVTIRSLKEDVRGVLGDDFDNLHAGAVGVLNSKGFEQHRQIAFAMGMQSANPGIQVIAAITNNDEVLPNELILEAKKTAVFFDSIMALRQSAAKKAAQGNFIPPQYNTEGVISATITAKDADHGKQAKLIIKPAESFAGRNGFPTHRIGVFYKNQYGEKEVCLMQLWEVLLYPSAFKLHVNGAHIMGIELLSDEMIAEQIVQRKIMQVLK